MKEARRDHFLDGGVHHATIDGHRFHLRLSKHDHHHLWIDGRQPPYVLDRVAGNFVRCLIDAMWLYQCGDGDESEQVASHVVEVMYEKYGKRDKAVTRERIRGDLDRIYGTLMKLANGGCPAEMGLDAKTIKYDTWTAPARLDLAVTYRCNLRCGKCYLPGSSEIRELKLHDWLKVFKIAWKNGVPQIVFTGGEPTMREDIVELVAQADEFATGLVTNGTRLKELAEPLMNASLDYAQVTIESHDATVHDGMTEVSGSHDLVVAGIRKSLEVGLQVVTNTTLTKANASDFPRTVSWLVDEIGVRHIACNTLICSGKGTEYRKKHGLSDPELRPILETVCRLAAENGIDFQWYSPTCYNAGINPMELGFGVKCCSAAAHNMTVQPDGSVLPCQSWPETVGNILTDKWDKIWKHPTGVKLRKHKMAGKECLQCEHSQACGGGCPLDESDRIPSNAQRRAK